MFVDLCNLSTLSNVFYHTDQIGPDGRTYRIFLYRLASYADWLHPAALESRGIMFRNNGADWELVCLPMEKFHNWNECPFTMNVDLTKIIYSMVKEDGSLISTYTDANACLQLKTKGSLHSEQAVNATAWLKAGQDSEVDKLLKTFESLEHAGWTLNCEWTSPLNRIVVPYQEDKLIVLNARHRKGGMYMERTMLEQFIPARFLVPISGCSVEDVAGLVGTEGIVAFFGNHADPRFMKVKADAYLILHRLKDGVNQPHALFGAVVHDQIDDLRASFAADRAVQVMINAMEELVIPAYNEFVAVTGELFQEHRNLDRKEFAITMQQKTKERLPLAAGAAFNAAMNMYLERSVKMVDSFIKSSQDRIVGEYKTKVVEALKEANLSTANTQIEQ